MTVLNSVEAKTMLATARALKARIEADAANLRDLTNRLSAMVGDEPGTHEVEGVGAFVVSPNNTYEADVMSAALLPGQRKRCMTASLDKAVVKRLYPDVYAAAKRTNGTKVTVK